MLHSVVDLKIYFKKTLKYGKDWEYIFPVTFFNYLVITMIILKWKTLYYISSEYHPKIKIIKIIGEFIHLQEIDISHFKNKLMLTELY